MVAEVARSVDCVVGEGSSGLTNLAAKVAELGLDKEFKSDVALVVVPLGTGACGMVSWCPSGAPVDRRMAGALLTQQVQQQLQAALEGAKSDPAPVFGGTFIADREEDLTPIALAASLKRLTSEVAATRRRAAAPASTGAEAEAEARRTAEVEELSSRERALLALDKAEGDARREFSSTSSRRASAAPSSTSSSSPSTASRSARPASVGGFHVVDMPLSDEATAAVRSLSGDPTLLELAVNEGRKGIALVGSARAVSPAALADALCADEPRFYLYRWAGKVLFIYWCPEGARDFKLRMVYSTAKGSVTGQLDAVGGEVASAARVEWSETTDLRASPESFLRSEMSPSSSRSSGGTRGVGAGRGVGASPFGPGGLRPTPGGYRSASASYGTSSSSASSSSSTPAARKLSTVSTPHPIYSLMGNSPSSTGKKKIVIPPRHAY